MNIIKTIKHKRRIGEYVRCEILSDDLRWEKHTGKIVGQEIEETGPLYGIILSDGREVLIPEHQVILNDMRSYCTSCRATVGIEPAKVKRISATNELIWPCPVCGHEQREIPL